MEDSFDRLFSLSAILFSAASSVSQQFFLVALSSTVSGSFPSLSCILHQLLSKPIRPMSVPCLQILPSSKPSGTPPTNRKRVSYSQTGPQSPAHGSEAWSTGQNNPIESVELDLGLRSRM